MVGARAARRGSVTATAVAVLASLALLVGGQAPARGHAAGQLPTAELGAEGPTVRVDLAISPDDAAVIGTALGYLDDGAMPALLGSGPEEDLPTAEEIAALSRSSELRDYLEANVAIHQDGRPCPGEADPGDDFLVDGASFTFVCPAPVEQAEVRITILHDEDPAYRTFSIDGTEQYAIHTAAAPTHAWDFTRTSTDDGLDPFLLAAAGVVGLLLVGAVIAVPRRRRARSR